MSRRDRVSQLASPQSERPSQSLRSYPSHPRTHAQGHDPTHYAQSVSQARASYPSFLSLTETLLLQLSWAWRGLVDAFRWDIVISTVARCAFPLFIPRHSVAYLFAIYGGSDAEIRANMFKSLLLNSLSLLSIYVFDLLLQPLVQDQQKWLHRNMGWFYSVLWLFPVVGASLYLNVS